MIGTERQPQQPETRPPPNTDNLLSETEIRLSGIFTIVAEHSAGQHGKRLIRLGLSIRGINCAFPFEIDNIDKIIVMKKLIALVLGSLLQATVTATPINVDVDLRASNFNPGPFTAGSAINVRFILDDTVTPTPVSTNYYWYNALDDLVITVDDPNLGTLVFNGTNGRFLQQPPGYLSGVIDGTFGSIAPNAFENDAKAGTSTSVYDPFQLIKFSFDFRLADQALTNYDNGQLVSGVSQANGDFDYLSLTLTFSHDTAGLITRANINLGQYFDAVTFNGNPIPVPAPVLLLLGGLTGLLWQQRTRRNS